MSRQISRSRSRLLGLEGGVKTKSRFLDLDWEISIVETNFLKVSRFSRLPRPALCQCRDRESRSRHNRDKSRPPRLCFVQLQKQSCTWKLLPMRTVSNELNMLGELSCYWRFLFLRESLTTFLSDLSSWNFWRQNLVRTQKEMRNSTSEIQKYFKNKFSVTLPCYFYRKRIVV